MMILKSHQLAEEQKHALAQRLTSIGTSHRLIENQHRNTHTNDILGNTLSRAKALSSLLVMTYRIEVFCSKPPKDRNL